MNEMNRNFPTRKPTICVFCGSSHGALPLYTEIARNFGKHMTEAGFDLVFGGGGIGLMGGAMLRDFAIVATAFEVQVTEARKAGLIGAVSLLLGTVLPFIVGACVAYAFGYTDAVSVTTIGAGAVTYIVGPVTGAALGASSDVMALSIATGLVKAILVMVGTPFAAKALGLNNPRAAMVFGGLAGTVSGVSAGLAATDRRLVPYGSLVATFHTGIGCLLGPSVLFLATKALIA